MNKLFFPFFALPPLFLFILLTACTAPTPIVPTSSPSPLPLFTASPTLTSLPSNTPTPSITPTRTPVPTYTPRLINTPTSIPAIYLPPDLQTAECHEPMDIASTRIDVLFFPFCVYWVDEFDAELGFQIVLVYDGGEVFAFNLDADTNRTFIPDEYAPRTYESQENCANRGAFTLSVFAILPETIQKIEQMAFEGECPFLTLPTATSSP